MTIKKFVSAMVGEQDLVLVEERILLMRNLLYTWVTVE